MSPLFEKTSGCATRPEFICMAMLASVTLLCPVQLQGA